MVSKLTLLQLVLIDSRHCCEYNFNMFSFCVQMYLYLLLFFKTKSPNRALWQNPVKCRIKTMISFSFSLFFFFTVSVNVFCFHVMHRQGSKMVCQLLLLVTTFLSPVFWEKQQRNDFGVLTFTSDWQRQAFLCQYLAVQRKEKSTDCISNSHSQLTKHVLT